MRFKRLCLSTCLLIIVISTISCGGFVKSKEIKARDFFYRDIILIPIDCMVDPNMGNETTFDIELEIESLMELFEEIINQNNTLKYEMFNNQWILINKIEENMDIPYIVTKLESKGELTRYRLSSPIITLRSNEKLNQKIMFPVYFIEDEAFDIHLMNLNVNQKYKINCTTDELIEFYDEIAFYEISEADQKYIITSNEKNEKKIQYFEGEIIINFETNDEASYITFEVKK